MIYREKNRNAKLIIQMNEKSTFIHDPQSSSKFTRAIIIRVAFVHIIWFNDHYETIFKIKCFK